jgi:hypothetical protein
MLNVIPVVAYHRVLIAISAKEFRSDRLVDVVKRSCMALGVELLAIG